MIISDIAETEKKKELVLFLDKMDRVRPFLAQCFFDRCFHTYAIEILEVIKKDSISRVKNDVLKNVSYWEYLISSMWNSAFCNWIVLDENKNELVDFYMKLSAIICGT